MIENPFGQFRDECEEALRNVINQLYQTDAEISLAKTPSPELGELASSFPFELSKKLGKDSIKIAEEIVSELGRKAFVLIKSVEVAGKGYVNFRADLPKLARETLESIRALNESYGEIKTKNPLRVIVEHTSVNPIHPIHIGQARNPVIGDSVSRLLKKHGHMVSTHFYVDDMGRQTAVLAYGYDKLDRPEVTDKPDRLMGKIYSITSCLLETRKLAGELARSEKAGDEEASKKKRRELDEWTSVGKELSEKYPDLFNILCERIAPSDVDPEKEIALLIRGYESAEASNKTLMRGVCSLSIRGFMETLERIGIRFDSWDWESDVSWSGKVEKVLEGLKNSPYVTETGGVLEFDANKVAQDFDLRIAMGLRKEASIPPLTLARLDGTTLYTTRDIAYSLWKFERADRVINVIGAEQSLPQLQLKLGLRALGYVRESENLFHLSYGLVELPGFKMSSRRGRYVTLDQVVEESIRRALEEVTARSPNLEEEERRRIAEIVGVGAVKYALIEVDASKNVTFTWDRVLNFETNSAPFIQYAYARTHSIMAKFKGEKGPTDYEVISHPLEKALVLHLSMFPEVFMEAANNLKPNMIAEFANSLADKFNSYYSSVPVIQAESRNLRDARMELVSAVGTVLRNALLMLGIEAPERM